MFSTRAPLVKAATGPGLACTGAHAPRGFAAGRPVALFVASRPSRPFDAARPSRGLAAALTVGLLLTAACADRAPSGDPSDEAGPAAQRAVPAGDPAPATDPFPALSAAEVCPDSGYLCQALEPGGELRVQRWPQATPLLTIRVPPAPVDDPARADALRRAVVRGFMAWDRHPFPLRILDRPDEGRDGAGALGADIEVSWHRTLEEGRLGRVHFQWGHLDGRELGFRVAAFELALGVPPPRARTLTPDDLERAAAHEMGHALGLLHSDDPRDLMYPSNTARSLSVRDYRTLEALYALPNGARIVGR